MSPLYIYNLIKVIVTSQTSFIKFTQSRPIIYEPQPNDKFFKMICAWPFLLSQQNKHHSRQLRQKVDRFVLQEISFEKKKVKKLYP